MSDTEKIINALKDEYSYWQNTAYKAQKEGMKRERYGIMAKQQE